LQIRDTLLVLLSDTHSGGSTALFPRRVWWFDTEHNHAPTPEQITIHKHWIASAAEAARQRKGKRLLLLHMGDAIEGWHHNTSQVVTQNKQHQKKLHVHLMGEFMEKAGFNHRAGDRLIYISGTEIHTGDIEDQIAQELDAELQTAPHFVELHVNGCVVWCVHQGAKSGHGHTQGDGFRNWLKSIYWDLSHEDKRIPDLIFSGHYHKHSYNSYVAVKGDDVKTVRGVILPSWQAKTRYVYAKSPIIRNRIGATYITISGAGVISDPKFFTIPTKNGETIEV
jgi:hypothetical protein